MMKILKPGDEEIANGYKFFECIICGCILRADRSEYSVRFGDDVHEDIFQITCPCCNQPIHSIENEQRINEIKQKYRSKLNAPTNPLINF